MALMPGDRLGPYEIRSSLGAGGMGEVYRAADTTLGRDVALKVLPDALARDPDRLARFEREARMLAALNHPHIAHIYGFERAGDSGALVLELVEGPTLAERIAQGALPVEETLTIAGQIADALESAHAQGIVHRDLKPANIKVTPEGTVKVLDFGLAKVTQASGSGTGVSGATAAPTITTPAMTAIGMILGTAAYMSPEQAKGREADERSDVWGFGCVLYEMLTGRRAFDGEDTSDTLASVLKTEPDWAALPADVPPPIRTLIQRCLVKERRARVASVSIARFVLAEATSLTANPNGPAGRAAAGHDIPAEAVQRRIEAAVAAARRTLLWRRVVPAAVAVLVIAIGAGVEVWRQMTTPSTPVSFAFTLPQDQRFSSIGRQMVAISPDGSQAVYAGTNNAVPGLPIAQGQRFYLRSLADLEPFPIPGTDLDDGVTSPVFSPDGASLAFYSAGALKSIPVRGGSPVTVCPAQNPLGLTWDSSGLVFGQNGGIYRCPATGGQPEQLAKVEVNERPYGPQVLPGGDAVLFSVSKVSDAERGDRAAIVVHSLRTGTRKTIVEGGSDGRYLPSGHLVYAVGGVLYARPFDPGRQEATGGPVGVVEGVRRAAGAQTGAAQFHTSNNGTLVYIPGPPSSLTTERAVAIADRAGTITRLALPSKPYEHVRASRDGKRIVLYSDDGKEAVVWVHELAGTSAPTRLTFAGRNRHPILSPDGQRVAFQSDREGDQAIFMQRSDGTGQVERLTKAQKDEIACARVVVARRKAHLVLCEQGPPIPSLDAVRRGPQAGAVSQRAVRRTAWLRVLT